MPFYVGAYFCMGAYKRDVVIVIKMGAYIHGMPVLLGAYYPDFTVQYVHSILQCLICSGVLCTVVDI